MPHSGLFAAEVSTTATAADFIMAANRRAKHGQPPPPQSGVPIENDTADPDPLETREWLDSLEVVARAGQERGQFRWQPARQSAIRTSNEFRHAAMSLSKPEKL